tara:strand:+ start:5032 stop:6099 length:1068 start_codon:yes stop_codon:yes gene_type:complete
MAQSSDEIIKREILQGIGTKFNGFSLRVFPESSNDDQKAFSDGGLTFGINGVAYGSCDACWVKKGKWKDPLTGKITDEIPIIALEGTDALNRGSSGNAQYQRFHHALGAVKSGIIGVYYLKKGVHKIQEDLFGMAYFVSKVEKGKYLIIDNLKELKELLSACNNSKKLKKFINVKLKSMFKIFDKKFQELYNGSWKEFAKKRSTIVKKGHIIKYSGRMKRNFTDGSQRAGHIAVGEMFLTKYFFPKKRVYYLWPRMTRKDIHFLDTHKPDDKEWKLLRNEPGVEIICIDDLKGVPKEIIKKLNSIKDKPLKGKIIQIFNKSAGSIADLLIKDKIKIIDRDRKFKPAQQNLSKFTK